MPTQEALDFAREAGIELDLPDEHDGEEKLALSDDAKAVHIAAALRDAVALKKLLRAAETTGLVNAVDPLTGRTALHIAIASLDEREQAQDGHRGYEAGTTSTSQASTGGDGDENEGRNTRAEDCVRVLFEAGAIWNDVDLANETPGCLAWRLGLRSLYELCVEAGVRAELLLGRLEGYQELNEDDEDEDEVETGDDIVVMDVADVTTDDVNEVQMAQQEAEHGNEDHTQAEDHSLTQPAYLASTLQFSDSKILDDTKNAVMMDWERDIMARTASLLLSSEATQAADASQLRVLNIGHGMGIFDTQVQAFCPKSHDIVEAHPDVIQTMNAQGGWLERARKGDFANVSAKSGAAYNSTEQQNITLHEGRWQTILPTLIAEGYEYDVVYFDTFAEDYAAFRDFFTEHLLGILAPTGRWSFFNGLGADRRVCYDVYTRVAEMDLLEAGFDVEWTIVHVPPELRDAKDGEHNKGEQVWRGVRRRYWAADLDLYRLPICTFAS